MNKCPEGLFSVLVQMLADLFEAGWSKIHIFHIVAKLKIPFWSTLRNLIYNAISIIIEKSQSHQLWPMLSQLQWPFKCLSYATQLFLVFLENQNYWTSSQDKQVSKKIILQGEKRSPFVNNGESSERLEEEKRSPFVNKFFASSSPPHTMPLLLFNRWVEATGWRWLQWLQK